MMTVYQNTESFVKERVIDIYFAPDHIDNTRMACLEIEFTTFRPMDVMLASLDAESENIEKLIYRIMTHLGDDLRVWRFGVKPELTNGLRFYIVIHIESTEVGLLAVIKRLQLTQGDCRETGSNFFCEFMKIT